jgi:hypothetical protein
MSVLIVKRITGRASPWRSLARHPLERVPQLGPGVAQIGCLTL